MRYAQIEKEALAVTWACTKFTDYILGCKFVIESDHKPLIPLLNTKHLDSLPPRILRFRLRLAKFDYLVCHVLGKLLYTADALSRAPASPVIPSEDDSLQDDAELFVNTIVSSLPASKKRLAEYQKAQQKDSTLSTVREYCSKGWPSKDKIGPDLKLYWTVRGSLSLGNNLLLYNNRIVVPQVLCSKTIEKIHEGHQGIERCRQRAQSSVWWPGMSKQVIQYVQQCSVCCHENRPSKQPLLCTPLPDYPWQVVGTDLFELKGMQYLLVIDYFSRYPEVIKMSSTTSKSTIAALKSVFSRHGIPEVVRSDNGPQYNSQEFTSFTEVYNFRHVTSSPLYPQSNGQAERSVQTVKKILRQSTLPDNSEVWVTSSSQPTQGRVITPVDTPRSYLVETPTGQIRRNQQHLNIIPDPSTQVTVPSNIPTARPRISNGYTDGCTKKVSDLEREMWCD